MKTLVAGTRQRSGAVPGRCSKCDEPLSTKMGAKDPEPKRHQVAVLPMMVHIRSIRVTAVPVRVAAK